MSMSTPALLRETHRLRRHIRDLTEEIKQAPLVLKAHQTKVAKREAELRDAQDTLKKLKAHQLERESSLKTTNQQLVKYEKQLGESADKKQYDAKQSEINHTQGVRQKLEEEILETMEAVDQKTAKLPEFEAALKKAQDELAGYQKEMDARVARLKEESARAQQELAGYEAQLSAPVRPLYDRLVKAFGADAFAAVKGQTCQQCYTSVTMENLNQLDMGQFVTCRSCARGLYRAE